mmetsp:Transcript_50494/g.83674  ORF Transcript_50494/g.83674 Transcript_50494/m.83674 type:complete len:218 (+) Transcript_50494:1245-1898(+)
MRWAWCLWRDAADYSGRRDATGRGSRDASGQGRNIAHAWAAIPGDRGRSISLLCGLSNYAGRHCDWAARWASEWGGMGYIHFSGRGAAGHEFNEPQEHGESVRGALCCVIDVQRGFGVVHQMGALYLSITMSLKIGDFGAASWAAERGVTLLTFSWEAPWACTWMGWTTRTSPPRSHQGEGSTQARTWEVGFVEAFCSRCILFLDGRDYRVKFVSQH